MCSRSVKGNKVDWNFEVSFLFFFVKKCKCSCLLVPSLRVLPRISSAQMGCEAVDIYSRMNGTPLAHLLVPLYTQQSKIILSPSFFFSFSFSFFFSKMARWWFSVGKVCMGSAVSIQVPCPHRTEVQTVTHPATHSLDVAKQTGY